MKGNITRERGLIALITVLIISSVVLLTALSTNLLGISEAQMGLKKQKTSQAFYLATACAEDALLRLQNNFTYTLTIPETVVLNGGSCDIISVTGTIQKEVRTEATVDNKTRRIKILVSSPAGHLVIDFWQEVADF